MRLDKIRIDQCTAKGKQPVIAVRNNMDGVNIVLILQILGDLRKSVAFVQHHDVNILAKVLNCIDDLGGAHYGRINKRHFVLHRVGRYD